MSVRVVALVGKNDNMTTLKDYAKDLIIEAQKKLSEENDQKVMQKVMPLTDEQIEELVEEFIENIKNRLIG